MANSITGGNTGVNNTSNNGIVEQLQNFKNNFKGDAHQQVMDLLNSGRLSQTQLTQLMSQAQQFRSLVK